MIVRPGDGYLDLIAQADHAALAASLMDAWQRDGLPSSPRRGLVLLATRRHDDGWIQEDAAPIVDSGTGRVLDFISAPADVRQGIWPRSVASAVGTPYAAALIAQHALSVNDPNRTQADWTDFFSRMERMREGELARAGASSAGHLQRDYFFVRMGDLLSLTFCCGWLEPQRHGEYDVRWTGQRLTVKPDPFAGGEVPIAITARRLPLRRFADAIDAVSAYDCAPTVTLTAIAAAS